MIDTTAEQDTTPVSQRVVERVADATDTDPTELAPLYGYVDPDSLDRLFAATGPRTVRTEGRVTFRWAGCRVVVHADGTVDVDDETTADVAGEENAGPGNVESRDGRSPKARESTD